MRSLPLLLVLPIAMLYGCQTAPPSPSPKPDEVAAAGAAACRVATVNPVTRHAECIDPPGAAVEDPPADLGVDCSHANDADAEWTYKSRCKHDKH